MKRALALLALAACHKDAPRPEDCSALVHKPLRELDHHAFARACGPLMPPACRPPTDGVPTKDSLPALEAACRKVLSGPGDDIFETALAASLSGEDRRVVAMALRSELSPPALALHLRADRVEVDGKLLSIDEAVAAVRDHGGGALLWGGEDAPEMKNAVLHALGETPTVICRKDRSNCR